MGFAGEGVGQRLSPLSSSVAVMSKVPAVYSVKAGGVMVPNTGASLASVTLTVILSSVVRPLAAAVTVSG